MSHQFVYVDNIVYEYYTLLDSYRYINIMIISYFPIIIMTSWFVIELWLYDKYRKKYFFFIITEYKPLPNWTISSCLKKSIFICTHINQLNTYTHTYKHIDTNVKVVSQKIKNCERLCVEGKHCIDKENSL